MAHKGRGNECSGTRWELDDEPKVPKNKVASARGVKAPKGGDGAPSLGQIVLVDVWGANRLRANIEGSAGELSNGLVIGAPKGGSAGLIRPCLHLLYDLLHIEVVALTIGFIGTCRKVPAKACRAEEKGETYGLQTCTPSECRGRRPNPPPAAPSLLFSGGACGAPLRWVSSKVAVQG